MSGVWLSADAELPASSSFTFPTLLYSVQYMNEKVKKKKNSFWCNKYNLPLSLPVVIVYATKACLYQWVHSYAADIEKLH